MNSVTRAVILGWALVAAASTAGCRKGPPPFPAKGGGAVVNEGPMTGKRIVSPIYLDGYAPAPYGLREGKAEFTAVVYPAARLTDPRMTRETPVTGRRCAFWWLEVTAEGGERTHEVFAGDAGGGVLIDVGDRLVLADAEACRPGVTPEFEETFRAGDEPDTGGLVPAHLFPRTIWREWAITEGTPVTVRVEKRKGSPAGGDEYVFEFAPGATRTR